MNEVETHRIAAAINQLRPDWPIASIKTLLQRPGLANRHRRDVAVALAWVACESESKTPARVLEAGPWWQGSTESTSPRVPSDDCCWTCNYTQRICRQLYENDHEFVSVASRRPTQQRENA